MQNYLIKLEYFGVDFYGQQNQMRECWPTIQSELMKALLKISPELTTETCKIQSSSRTDRGVHALCLYSNIMVRKSFEEKRVLQALNFHLPNTIRVTQCTCTYDKRVDLRTSIKSKEYRYYFYPSTTPHPLFLNHMVHVPYPLDMEKIEKALKLFIGTQDFQNFQCAGTIVQSTIRTIYHLSLTKQAQDTFFPFPENTYMLRIVGNGFLKQMIRLIVGTLWAIGRGKLTIDELEFHLKNPSKKKLGVVAPAQGLYLYNVEFTHI